MWPWYYGWSKRSPRRADGVANKMKARDIVHSYPAEQNILIVQVGGVGARAKRKTHRVIEQVGEMVAGAQNAKRTVDW